MKDDSQEAMLCEILRLAEDSEWPSTRRERIADLARELLSRMPEPPRARTTRCETCEHDEASHGPDAGEPPIPYCQDCFKQSLTDGRTTTESAYHSFKARTEAGPYLPLLPDGPVHVHADLQINTRIAPSESYLIVGGEVPLERAHPVDEREDRVARTLGYGDDDER